MRRRQAEAVYDALLDALAAEGAGPEAIVSETVFLRRIREDAEVARLARSRVLGASGLQAPPAGDDADRPASARWRRATRALRNCHGSAGRRFVVGACGEPDLRLRMLGLRVGRERAGRPPRRQYLPARREHPRIGARRLRGSVRHVPCRRGPTRRGRDELRQRPSHLDSRARHRSGLCRAQQSPTRVLPPLRHRAKARQHWRSGKSIPRRARLLLESPCGECPSKHSTSRRCAPRC